MTDFDKAAKRVLDCTHPLDLDIADVHAIAGELQRMRLGAHFSRIVDPPLPMRAHCGVCGIDFSNGPMSYTCSNAKCPTGFRAQ